MPDDHLHCSWRTLDELFGEAVRRTGTARAAFLDRACNEQPSLRAAVERMLWADEAAGTFLERPVAWRTTWSTEAIDDGGDEADDAGLELGPYRLVELIATGGMGAVYRAERMDDAFHRTVAIKMMRRRIARGEELQRFRTEREVLARLDHPNIARLLDGGTTDDGRPFLVMELVDGLPINRYCEEKKLPLSARVQLFQQVCAAIECAHQNLLIHRDIKPDNILVTGDGTVKVLDFGIAKLLEPESLPFSAPLTRTGLRPMTPGYASPEQIRGQPATTRSEVFVLGALLYELLEGHSPFMVEGELPHEIEAAICAADGLPGRPGHHLKQGRDDCSRALRGDLGNIIGQTLRADPARRYGSVGQLSDDLTRWAEHRPVRARPDRLTYRMRTFVRRNRALVSLTVVAFTGLVVLSLGLLVQTRTVVAERDRASRALSFVAGIFERSDTSRHRGRPVDPRESLDRSADQIERELSEHPDMQAVLFDSIGRMYISLGWFDEARHRLEQSLALRRRLGEDGADLATGLHHLARALNGQGDYEQAWARFDESLTIRRDLFGPEHPAVAEALTARAQADVFLGRFDRAEPSIREALGIRRAQLGNLHLDVAESLSRLGDVLYASDQDPEAVVQAYQEALAIRKTALGEDHLLVADSLSDVSLGLFNARRGYEALPVIQRAVDIKRSILSRDHPELVTMLFNLGEIARNIGNLALAESSLREAVEIAHVRLGALHPDTAHPRLSLGILLLQQGQLDEADEQFEQVQQAYEASYGADHPRHATLTFWRGDLLRLRGDYDAARRLLEESRRLIESHTPSDSIIRASVKLGMGRLALDTGAPETALTLFEDSLAILQMRPNAAWYIGEVETEIGRCQATLGRVEQGRATILRGLGRLERYRSADDPKVVRARGFLSKIDNKKEQAPRPALRSS